MNVKIASGPAALISACLFATAGQAGTMTIFDNTKNVSYHGTNPTNWFAGGTTSLGDVVEGGPEFDTQKVIVTVTDDTIEFKFYTQFDGSDLGAHYADIFLATDPAHPDAFNYGIALGYQQPYGGKAAAFYSVTPANYKTSIDIWGPQTGFIYAGQYVNPFTNVAHAAPTVITGGSIVPGWTVTTSQSTVGGTYPYLLDVTLTAGNGAMFAGIFGDKNIAAFWGTGDCNNDSLYMGNIKAPEPASMALFAGGLFGLGAIRHRRAKS
jgi:hypothetical protein